jgi:hypothetical protein
VGDVGGTASRGGESSDPPQLAADAAPESEAQAASSGAGEAPPHVFISYRHADTGAQAFLLHDRLKRRFGESNVFLDVAALKPGMDWREAIHARANACGVLIVLIGVKWASLMSESAQRNLVEPVDDVARQELEIALGNPGNIDVLPVLVDGATMPAAHELPTTLQRLTDRQAERLELVSYDQDVDRLIERLITLQSEPKSPPNDEGADDEPARGPGPAAASSPVGRLAGLITGNGHVAAVLGYGVNSGLKELPDSQRLATVLASRFGYETDHPHLSEVAQYVDVTWGRPDLHATLTETLGASNQPGPVHRFLAGLQTEFQSAGMPRRPFLALTTNFDSALERAFRDAGEPFHLAVYMAATGRFVHVKPDGTQQEIFQPNGYSEFPIQDDLRLSETLIVKLHGAIGQRALGYSDADNYVITEDNYIDYLSGSSVEQIVPVQILQKLKASHCVFFGYDITDWSLRVLLKRVWGSRIPAKSWAVEPDAHEFEEVLWRETGVELIPEPLDAFVADLQAQLRHGR